MKAAFILFALVAAAYAQNIVECDACTFLVKTIDQYLDENTTVSKIDGYVDGMCKYLPSAYDAPCDAILNAGVSKVVQFIEIYETPEKVCAQEFHFCAAAQKKPVVEAPAVADTVGCSACHVVINVIENLLEKNSTQEEITQEVEHLCNLIHSDICNAIVEQYIPIIIQYLEQEITPNMICAKLGFCTASAKATKKAVKAVTVKCSICHTVVSTIEKYLAEDKTEEEITAYVEKICTIVNSPVCDNLVQNYIPVIIQYLEAKQTPEVICQEIGICTASAKKTKKVGDTKCDLCQLAVAYAKQYIQQGDLSDAEIIAKVTSDVCGKLSGTAQMLCQFAMQNYLPKLLAAIRANIDAEADQVCKQINLC